MYKRIFNLLAGSTIASLGISCVIKAGLGCFPITAANIAVSNWLGLSVGVASMIVELTMILIATLKGEGMGVTSIVNAIYGSLMIDVFSSILPSTPFMIIGLVLLPLGWSIFGRAELGDTGSNLLTNVLLKNTNMSIGTIRGIIEVASLVVGFLGARNQVTVLTVILSLFFGYLMQFVYKIVNYKPDEIDHSFIIKLKSGSDISELESNKIN